MNNTNNFASITQALDELQKGNMLIVVDDPTRENQGDIIFPAATITTEKANFLIKECRGIFCVPLTKKRAAELEIPLMVPTDRNTEKLHCNFGITVDAYNVADHGISAADRALTVQTLRNPQTKPTDLLRPGHVSPIIAVNGGVLERNGHTEATIDLCRLAGFEPIGVLSEILNDKGEPAKGEELFDFARKHNLKIISIKDLVAYRQTHPLPIEKQPSIVKLSEAQLPTKYGEFTISIYRSLADNKEHAVLVMGEINKQPALTRIHSECLTGDTLSSLRCDCQGQLVASMQAIQKKGSGILIYLNQEGRGIGLGNKIKAYALQDQGLDTVEANHALGFITDLRDYQIAAEMIHDLGISKIDLLTNNPKKIEALQKHGVEVVQRLPLEIKPNEFNRQYLATKKSKLQHQLTEV